MVRINDTETGRVIEVPGDSEMCSKRAMSILNNMEEEDERSRNKVIRNAEIVVTPLEKMSPFELK